jgi:hypothetical protein
MADQFRIVPHTVRAAGTDVPPEQVQFGFNKMANDVTIALNTLAAGESSNVNITGGTIANVAISNSTGVTQSRLDNTTLLATDAFVNQQIASSTAAVPIPLTAGTYNQASRGSGASFVIFVSGGVISSVLSVVSGGTGYAVGDLLVCVGGNSDGLLRVTNVVGGVIQSGGLTVLYGGTGYTTGATVAAVPVPPGQRSVYFTGALTGNVTFIIQNGTFLTASRRVQFNNNTTGAFTVTVKLSDGLGGATGTGVVLPQGTNNSTAVIVQTDGQNDVWLSNTSAGIGAAGLASPAFTGTPTAPTAATNTNTTQLSTTAFVEGEFASPPAAGFGSTTPRPVAATTVTATGMSRVIATTTNALSIPNNTQTVVTTFTATLNQGTNFVAATGVFTAPATAQYEVNAAFRATPGSVAAGSQFILQILVNGTIVLQTGSTYQSAAATACQAHIAAIVNATSGQTVTVAITQTTGITLTLDGSGTANWLTINRLY